MQLPVEPGSCNPDAVLASGELTGAWCLCDSALLMKRTLPDAVATEAERAVHLRFIKYGQAASFGLPAAKEKGPCGP